MTLYGYARVSTDTQNLDRQKNSLTSAGVTPDHLYTDVISGRTATRPALTELLAAIQPGDTLVVTDLDRLGRDTVQVIQTVDNLNTAGVGLRILRMDVDTSTSEGRFMMRLMASLAEMEADKIRERTKDGLRAARLRGSNLGRPRVLSVEQRQMARDLKNEGRSTASIARLFGVADGTVRKALQATK